MLCEFKLTGRDYLTAWTCHTCWYRLFGSRYHCFLSRSRDLGSHQRLWVETFRSTIRLFRSQLAKRRNHWWLSWQCAHMLDLRRFALHDSTRILGVLWFGTIGENLWIRARSCLYGWVYCRRSSCFIRDQRVVDLARWDYYCAHIDASIAILGLLVRQLLRWHERGS